MKLHCSLVDAFSKGYDDIITFFFQFERRFIEPLTIYRKVVNRSNNNGQNISIIIRVNNTIHVKTNTS